MISPPYSLSSLITFLFLLLHSPSSFYIFFPFSLYFCNYFLILILSIFSRLCHSILFMFSLYFHSLLPSFSLYIIHSIFSLYFLNSLSKCASLATLSLHLLIPTFSLHFQSFLSFFVPLSTSLSTRHSTFSPCSFKVIFENN